MCCNIHMKGILIFLIIFLSAAVLHLAAQESASDAVDEDPIVYRIREVEYQIDGKTRKRVLARYLGIEPGERLEGRSSLDEYLADKLQLIKNQRTLAGGSIIPAYEPDSEVSNLVHVDLTVKVSDTWNYVVLPYGKYDSNEGLLISLRGRNYNFLGGMEELAVNLDYLKPSIEESEYSLNSEFSIPFFLYGYELKIDFEEDVTVSSDDPTYFYTKAGLSVDLPLKFTTLKASLDQRYYLNRDGDDDADGWYMSTSGRIGSSIPLGVELPGFIDLDYNSALITSVAYKPGDTISEDRRGYELGAEHSITAGRIDWLKNFRDGNELEMSQNLRWNFQRERWISDFDTELQVHKSFGFMGFSSRLQGFYRYGGEIEDAGSDIRGILDSRIDAKSGFFANFDFPIKMWIWFLDRWFEGHISPFFDYGLVQAPGESYDFSNGWYGIGMEGFAFPKFARSIYLRMSLGLDLEAMIEGAGIGDSAPRDGEPIYEVYLGLGHYY